MDTTTVIMIIIGSVSLIAIGVLVWVIKQYNIKVTVWLLANNRCIKIDDKAWKRKDKKTGATYYHLWRLKEVKYGEAPPEAVEVNDKGTRCMEMYRLGQDQYAWRTNKIKKVNIITKKDDKTGQDYEDFEVIESFQPITDDDRMIIVQSVRIAEEIKNMGKKTWMEHLPQIIAFGFIAIVLIGMFAFWGQIWQPMREVHQQQLAQQQVILQSMQEQRALLAELRGFVQMINPGTINQKAETTVTTEKEGVPLP
jgi:hypothetical protein